MSTLINTTPIYGEDGELVSVVATIQDITPLEELERLRAEFLGMVSHELRTPLASIKGSAATVLGTSSPLDPAETRQFFRIIEEQADHMRDLHQQPARSDADRDRNLVGRSRTGGCGRRDCPGTRCVPEQWLTGITSRWTCYRTCPASWRIGSESSKSCTTSSPDAAKYSREWSTIRVTAAREDLYVVISVTDEGRGIAAEHLPRLFSKFSRIDGDDGRQVGGLWAGPGNLQGYRGGARGPYLGRERWTGTRPPASPLPFPAAAETGASVATGSAPVSTDSERAPTELERILIVDDDPQILRYVRSTLSEAGYVSRL